MDLREVFATMFLGDFRPVRNMITSEYRLLLADPLKHFMTLKDTFKYNAKVYIQSEEMIKEKNISPEFFYGLATGDAAGGFNITSCLFYPTLYMLCNDKQRERWCKDAFEGRMVGAYAQTELRHGSDVQSLQTTATFDPETSTFVINTPTIFDSKFWPGALGILCTHLVTQARTYINGKYCGIQTFFLQVRDLKTYKPIEGIEVGDIGEKLGFRTTDNGYLRFNNVRVPWDHLLMRFFEIDEKGNILTEDAQSARFGYGGMLNLRNQIVRYFVLHYLYSTMWSYDLQKTQENIDKNRFLTRFVNRCAYILTHTFLYDRLRDLHKRFMNTLAVNDIGAAKVLLADLHLMTAGFKAIGSWESVAMSREIMSETGQGGLYVTERPTSYTTMIPTSTYEGDNSVLLQQLSRALIRYVELLMKGKEIKGVGEAFNVYAKNIQERIELPVFDLEKEPLTLDSIEKLLRDISFKNIAATAEKFVSAMGESDLNTAWNEKMQTELIYMSRVYLSYQAFQYALTTYRTLIEKNTEKSANAIVSNLLLLQGLVKVKEVYNLGVLSGLLVGSRGYERLMEEIKKTEDALKPQAEVIRGAIYVEPQEIGWTQGLDAKILEERGKPVRSETEKIEKDFSMQFLKMSKL